jgi:hypothetical protein
MTLSHAQKRVDRSYLRMLGATDPKWLQMWTAGYVAMESAKRAIEAVSSVRKARAAE